MLQFSCRSVKVKCIEMGGTLLRVGDLPPACSISFTTDITGGHPGGVWYSSLRHVTARPATRAPVTARGRRCTAAPDEQERPTPHVPQPLLHCVRRLRASQALHGLWCGVANGAGPWGCTAGVTLASPRGPRTGGLRRDRRPWSSVPPQWQATTHTIQERATMPTLATHEKTR